MTDSTIDVLVWFYDVLLYAIPFVSLLALWQLFTAIVGWRTAYRNVRLRRFGMLVGTALLIPVLLTGLWRGVIRPALGSKLLAEVNRAREEKDAKTTVVQVGDSAPPFSVVTVDGEEFSLPSAGNVVLINFFATWCGPCQVELPHIDKIWADNKSNPRFRLIVIGREESTKAVLSYREAKGFTFPIAADPDRAVYSRFASESIPRTLVVSADGRIVYSKVGFMEEDLEDLKTALSAQLRTANN